MLRAMVAVTLETSLVSRPLTPFTNSASLLGKWEMAGDEAG